MTQLTALAPGGAPAVTLSFDVYYPAEPSATCAPVPPPPARHKTSFPTPLFPLIRVPGSKRFLA